MKKILQLGSIGLCLLSFSTFASELVIERGQNYVVTPDQMNLALDKLVIGDNAKITFADGVNHWELLAKDATIGHGVVIDGSGKAGAAGQPGEAYGAAAKSCQSGKSGNSGEAGEPGGVGIDIYLGLDARKIGSMKVLADGGAGGVGGAGGAGQDAGSIVNCPPAKGGSGGHGGPGGDGGRGGNVVVSVSPLDATADVGAMVANVRVSVKPGKAGKGGEGGAGGAGTEGQYINQKTLAGSRKWVAGGPSGRFGANGDDGNEGAYGQVFVGGKFTGFPSVSTHADGFEGFDKFRSVEASSGGDDAAQKEIETLKEQLRALQERMEKLEK